MSNFTETSHLGWFGRIKNAIGGMVFGVILTLVAVFGLFWNEGRAVKRYKTLKEGEGAVVSVMADAIDPANEGKLVHLSGTSEVKSGPLKDPVFGVVEPGVKLKRTAEMYQWDERKKTETKKKTGGSTTSETTYSYSRKWADKVINSQDFKQSGHDNPRTMPYKSETIVADKVDLGAFTLASFLVQKINDSEDVTLESLDSADAKVKESGKLVENRVYFGADPESPKVGDVRVGFTAVRTGPVSVVAQQIGESFSIYKTEYGTIQLLTESTKSAPEMFEDAHTSNKIMTWAIRGGGFLLMSFGIGLLFKPLSVVADVLPFVGNLVGAGMGFVATILAAIISFVTIAIAWVVYRPLLGVALIVVAIGLCVLLIKRVGQKKVEAALAEGSPPPL